MGLGNCMMSAHSTMNLKVIIPLGPGHEQRVQDCLASVYQAIENQSTWDKVVVNVVDDTAGRLGRSAARNSAIHGADWYFFIDADDRMVDGALDRNSFAHDATFGAVHVGGQTVSVNVFPCSVQDVVSRVVGTLSMGFFYRDTGLRFNEALDNGEDFDFYLRLKNWTKIQEPLVDISPGLTSAVGPRGNTENRWVEACREVINGYDLHELLGEV